MARRRKTRPRRRRLVRITLVAAIGTVLLATAALAAWSVSLDRAVRAQFEGKRWAVPATVYARPLELYAGLSLDAGQLREELAALNYRQRADARGSGTWHARDDEFVLGTRAFNFWDGAEPARRVRVRLGDERVLAVTDADSGEALPLVRLDPARIGNIFPAQHREDRLLVRLDEVPDTLVAALLAVEDADFHDHFGLSPSGIARAAAANLRARRVVQGGSTITQQLVKNFYLSSDRTMARKLREAIMAVLLERRYDKDDILETYLNEVFLVQDHERAIHGMGLASRHLFGEPLAQLPIEQQALLVAMINGPSYYHPRRHPERALARRNLVLDTMAHHGIVSADDAERASARPLGVAGTGGAPRLSHPAFMGVVQRHLRRDYRAEDLQSEGLQIFTTLAPSVQAAAESALVRQLGTDDPHLQAAVVITDVGSGEVLALIGDRNPRFAGFNRALDARRPVGSLIKPAVFLAALQEPSRFGLGSLLDDAPLALEQPRQPTWAPRNYDREFRGPVMMVDALAQSLNVPTVRAGLEVGLPAVQATVERLGAPVTQTAHPSYLIGTGEFTPLEVAQMYQTLASGGFRTPLRAVRAVTTQDGRPLNRYPLSTAQAFEPGPVHLVNSALVAAMRDGTGRTARRWLSEDLQLAGKTGTTDQGRDSWFAGFGDDLLGVVWLGRDDFSPAGLTCARNALPVWADTMRQLRPAPLALAPPDGVETVWIDSLTGLRSAQGCDHARALPYLGGHAPEAWTDCGERRERGRGGLVDRLRRIFQ